MQIHLKLSIILVCILLLLDRLIKKVSQNDFFSCYLLTLQKMYFHYFMNNKETIKSHQYRVTFGLLDTFALTSTVSTNEPLQHCKY